VTKHTWEKWAERVRAWRASGLSVEEFTVGKDYKASTLRWAVSQLNLEGRAKAPRSATGPGARARGRSAEKPSTTPGPVPRFLPVRMRQPESMGAELVLEVGGARLRVTRGVDLTLVGDVVRMLAGGVR
jgi:hypothetical protein